MMRNGLLALLVMAIALSPLASGAQEGAPTPVQAASLSNHRQFVHDKLLTMGAGAVIGALLGSYFVALRGSMVVGALAGGFVAGWWYGAPETLIVTQRDKGETDMR